MSFLAGYLQSVSGPMSLLGVRQSQAGVPQPQGGGNPGPRRKVHQFQLGGGGGNPSPRWKEPQSQVENTPARGRGGTPVPGGVP